MTILNQFIATTTLEISMATTTGNQIRRSHLLGVAALAITPRAQYPTTTQINRREIGCHCGHSNSARIATITAKPASNTAEPIATRRM